ncbi:M20/M25/M40 family metallo-hydrolase, partial [Parvimonas sp. D9]|uniref:M20/M25/M40 family metallo-hydrolase n=1 Tax=Parvimonas sp. D9 TaxID=3110689 RepID=UPI002B498D1F
ADDKSGVAIIMDMAHYLMQHPELPHGIIKILFTPDEEVGRGTEKLDMQNSGQTLVIHWMEESWVLMKTKLLALMEWSLHFT